MGTDYRMRLSPKKGNLNFFPLYPDNFEVTAAYKETKAMLCLCIICFFVRNISHAKENKVSPHFCFL